SPFPCVLLPSASPMPSTNDARWQHLLSPDSHEHNDELPPPVVRIKGLLLCQLVQVSDSWQRARPDPWAVPDPESRWPRYQTHVSRHPGTVQSKSHGQAPETS